jgi:apolipoprotein N-acyltransferase
MVSIAERVILASGWRKRFIALIAGAVGALAMAPFDLFPALIAPMTVGVWMLDGASETGASKAGRFSPAALRSAFAVGWWIGFGYFLAGLWWLGAAFLVEADKFAWALPLGVVGLPIILAIFTGVGFVLARLLWRPGPGRILIFTTALGVSEIMRGLLFTGFPWNVFGMALGGNPVLAQAASGIGLYGLTFLAIAVFAAPATLADPDLSGASRRWTRSLTCAVVALVALAGFGGLRLATASQEMVKGVKLRIMQPNLPQDAKFRPENKAEILRRYLTLSDKATSPRATGLADVTHLVWPESAFPFILARDAQALAQIGAALPPGVTLVTGAVRVEEAADLTRGSGDRAMRYFNAIQIVASGGTILESADKVHLVPFGEYLPFGKWLDRIGLRQFVHIPGGFDAATRRNALRVPGLPMVAPLVCYEAIFPGEVTPEAPGERPGLMLNVTNDGWFGQTTGPYQHLAQARLRSIEEGLPLVRAANTGVSAVIDPYGRFVAKLPLGVDAVLDSPLPQKISPTLFSRWPWIGAILIGIFMLISGLVLGRRRAP